jgi:hypothetical protein
MQNTLTTNQIKSLEDKIYDTLMITPFIDESDGEVMERGMGEMGETHDEAQRIVSEWMDETGIKEEIIYECEICKWEGTIGETIHRSDSSDSGFYDYHGCPKCDNVIIDNLSK